VWASWASRRRRSRWTAFTSSTPGQTVTVGDHRLTAEKPPLYDNPITTGFVDDRTGVFFSPDCFGALLAAVPENAGDLDLDELRMGQVRWATIDSSWIHEVDPSRGPNHRALDGVQ
jgi:hypothetical protein